MKHALSDPVGLPAFAPIADSSAAMGICRHACESPAGRSALVAASRYGRDDVARLLLGRSAHVNAGGSAICF